MPALYASRLFDGEKICTDMSVIVKDGLVADVVAGKVAGANEINGLLSPGFIDCQVNGGGGVMLNDDPSPTTISKIAKAHLKRGTTSFLPTLISDTREKIKAAIGAADAAIAQKQTSVLGIHIEGPFLNVARRGVHPAAHIIEAQDDDIALLSSLKNGVTLVTLAPEEAPPGFIKQLAARGVIVNAGHTDATSGQIEAALKEGVRGFTHLYNAMSQMQQRAPSVVGAALADDQSFASIIADGHHVSVENLRVALKAKTAKKLFLVSDAMASLGAGEKSFNLFDETIHVEGGRLTTVAGTLAGAHIDMAGAVRFMAQQAGATLEQALMMATSTPASFLKLENRIGTIAPGCCADFVLLDEKLNVTDVWCAGDKQ
jgi:N-acetylglucosamine-6-phosphate deacetylase